MGILAIVRFPMDARHPGAQTPYEAYAVGEIFPFIYQDQLYYGRVIERLVSRADGLVELHVQAVCGEGLRPAPTQSRQGLRPAPTQSRQEGEP